MAGASRGIVLRQIDRLYRDGTLAGMGDSQLLERYLTRRDEAAFEAIVDRHGPMVLGLCSRMLRDPRDIEDAFQATFLILVRRAAAIQDRHRLSSWLYGVAFRVASRARTNSRTRRGREIALASVEPACAGEAAEFRELAPVLDQELSRLPEKYRAALIMCCLNGQTHDQAAESLACPVGTVRSRLSRGRELLRRRLASRGYAPGAAILGSGHALPAQLLSEAVPRALTAATVEAALAFETVRIIHAGAGAASVLALTEGVLMTMKLAPLRWIALGAVAASLSAGGYAAIAYSANPGAPTQGAVAFAWPAQQTAATGSAASSQPKSDGASVYADRLEALERKVEELLNRLAEKPTSVGSDLPKTTAAGASSVPSTSVGSSLSTTPPAGSTSAESASVESSHPTTAPARTSFTTFPTAGKGSFSSTGAAASGTTVSSDTGRTSTAERGGSVTPWARGSAPATVAFSGMAAEAWPPVRTHGNNAAIRELEAQLRLALEELDRSERLFRQAVISQSEHALKRGEVLIVAAKIEGIGDDLADEMSRMELELRKAKAEVIAADAKKEVAASMAQRYARLNQERQGIVSPENLVKADGDLRIADAERMSKQAEVGLIELRLSQLSRYRQRINEMLARDARTKAIRSEMDTRPFAK
jgi:RNA polymerase sigma factor (sigma-70 family)